MKKKVWYILVVMMLVCNLIGCSTITTQKKVEEQVEIYVFMAASLQNAMEEIKTNYEKEHSNVNILFNADSSGALQTQIEEGAPCDLFFSAATKQINGLEEKKLVVEGSLVNLLENKVVLIKASGENTMVTGFETITNASSIALAGEDVPAGAYAREIFTSIGNLDEVNKMEINECANVTAVLTSVSEKSNEVGVVYATDAESMSDSVEVIAIAPDTLMKEPVLYPVAQIVNETATKEEKSATSDFLKYLQSKEAEKVFTKYGFLIHAEK